MQGLSGRMLGYLALVLGSTRGADPVPPMVPLIPETFEALFNYSADGIPLFIMNGVQGEHGYVTLSPPQQFYAWRLDTIMSGVNTTVIDVLFRNQSERITSFYTAGPNAPSVAGAAAAQGPRDASTLTPGGILKPQSSFVGGCSQGSQSPLGLIGIDLSWIYDPSFEVSFVAYEMVNGVLAQHWTSRRCYDVWVKVDTHGIGSPVRLLVQTVDPIINYGCIAPSQQADYMSFTPITGSDAATNSPIFMPPAICFPQAPSGENPGGPGSGAPPPWVWFVVGCAICLAAGLVSGFVLGARRRARSGQEDRERYTSHLLDVI